MRAPFPAHCPVLVQTALDLAGWLTAEALKLVGGRSVERIIVQATAESDVIVTKKGGVVRCGEPFPQLPAHTASSARSVAAFRTATAKYCNDGFFHFYLPFEETGHVSLNWVLSDATVRFIRRAIDATEIGNAVEGQKSDMPFTPPDSSEHGSHSLSRRSDGTWRTAVATA